MKKITFTLLFTLAIFTSWSQIVTTNPTFIDETTSNFTIYYNASSSASSVSCAGLSALTSGVYAHIGAIITGGSNPSTTDTDWKYVLTPWPSASPNNYAKANTTKNALTYNPTTKLWALQITGNIREFLGITNANEKVKKIALVFRNSTGSAEGKGPGTPCSDIMLNVGYSVSFSTPTADGVKSIGSDLPITIITNLPSTIKLVVNGNVSTSQTNATTLSSTYSFVSAGDYQFIAEATAQNVTIRDTLNFAVAGNAIIESRPANDLPGIKTLSNTSVRLVLHAPNKNNVMVIGDINNWTPGTNFLMKKDGEYWWLDITGLSPDRLYRFQYLVDGTVKICDPYTELALDPWNDKWINEKNTIFPNVPDYPVGKTDGLVATFKTTKTSYSWEIPTFTMPSKDNMVIYELLVRDFTTERSLSAAIERLDYLQNLGITAVELMPIQEFEGNNSWGYNPNLYFAPDKAYGNPEMYKKFIDECHKRGIAVLLDVVFNQSTGLHPFAALFWDSTNSRPATNNPWMNAIAPHQFSVLNDFNHSYVPTREYFKRVLKYWITEYNIDGYRLDLTKGFTQNSNTESVKDQSRIDYLTEYYNAAKEVKNDVMFILEHFCAYDEELELANKGMYLWRNVNNSFSQAAMGVQSDSDFGGLNSLPRRWIGYAESHDEERNFYKAKTYGVGIVKTDSVYRISRVPLNIAFTTLIPGPKMIWQFGEMGYDYSINSQGGRTNPKPSAWGLLNLAHRKAAADASAKIITLRKMYPNAFNQGNFSIQASASDWESGRRIELTHSELNMIVLGNFKEASKITAFPNFPKTGTWYNLLTGQPYYVGYANNPIEVEAGQVLIFTDKQINLPNSVSQQNSNDFSLVYPTTTSGRLFINTPTIENKINVYNLQGKILQSDANKSEISIEKLNNGLYIVEVICNEIKQIHKIIKN